MRSLYRFFLYAIKFQQLNQEGSKFVTFLENFEQQCRLRGESPSHALSASGLSPSLYGKWKKQPERMPYGATVKKLADYFGCSFEFLETKGRASHHETDTMTAINQCLQKLSEQDQNHILSYILFVYGDDLPDEMQKLRKHNS